MVGVRDRAVSGGVLRLPLLRASRTRRLLPLVLEEVLEEVVAPPGRRRGPGDLEAARDGVGSPAGFVAALPAETLLLEVAALRFGTDMGRRTRAVGLAERVAPGDERDRLLVVHRHAAERFANVLRSSDGIRSAVRPFGIDVDEAHLHGAERIGQLPFAAVALVAEPRGLGPPVDVLGLPPILAPAGEAERLEPHRLQGDVAGQDHQVGPRDLPAVLLFDRPEQPARLVEVRVVGPAAERRKAQHARPCAAAAVVDAVRARTVPRHSNEQRAVMTEIRRPPVLRRRHRLLDVLLHGIEIERLELFSVVELRAHGIACRVVRVEGAQVQLIRPPLAVRPADVRFGVEGALLFVAHGALTSDVINVGVGVSPGPGPSRPRNRRRPHGRRRDRSDDDDPRSVRVIPKAECAE